VLAAVAPAPVEPSAFQLLSILLTTESLLFAGLTVAITLAGATPFGRQIAVLPVALACAATLILGVVAAAAVLSWTDLFAGSNWPKGHSRRVEAIALLSAIVTQPAIALSIAVGIWRG
jgi:hypothetical protein